MDGWMDEWMDGWMDGWMDEDHMSGSTRKGTKRNDEKMFVRACI